MTHIHPSSMTPKTKRAGAITTTFALLVIGAAFGALAYRFVGGPSGGQLPERVVQSVPQFVREGARIIVPDGSPLRAKLAIEPVSQKEVQRNLVLPAVVEADPARLVKVLPPLAGRITQLKVQLGEEVEKGQPLLVLDSADLDTAYADYERGKANSALAAKTRDRLRELVRTSAVAIRELQQAETDLVNAEVEKQRAESRLRQIGVEPEVSTKSRSVTIVAPLRQHHRSQCRSRGLLERRNGGADDCCRSQHHMGDSQRAGKRHSTGRKRTVCRNRIRCLPR